jgi:hypothetical protein
MERDMNKRQARWVAVTTAGAIALAGCANTGVGGLAGGDDDPCNLIAGTLIGGIAGALLDRNKRGRGAAIGAAAGALACVAVNAVSRQTRTAQQVEADYRRENRGQLPPDQPVVQAYDVTVNPDDGVKSGEKLQVVSNMTVVRGARQPVNEVKEVLTLTSPDGNSRSAEKSASAGAGSGSYQNAFSLTLPKGVAPGTYPVNTQLYVNGKPLAERKQELRVVMRGNVLHFALADVTLAARQHAVGGMLVANAE